MTKGETNLSKMSKLFWLVILAFLIRCKYSENLVMLAPSGWKCHFILLFLARAFLTCSNKSNASLLPLKCSPYILVLFCNSFVFFCRRCCSVLASFWDSCSQPSGSRALIIAMFDIKRTDKLKRQLSHGTYYDTWVA